MTTRPSNVAATSEQGHTRTVRAVVLAVSCALCACVSYSPNPVSVPESATNLRAQSLDPIRARAELDRIAPGYVWQGDEWNVLTLLVEALRLNPELSRSRAAYSAALADVEASRVAPGPAASLAVEYAFDPPESSNWLYGIAADLPVDRGERKHGRIATAEVRVRAAALDFASAAWSVRQSLRRSLDAQASWAQEAGVAEELVAARRHQFETLQRRLAAGEVARTELDLVRASLADALQARAAAGSMLARSRLDIAAAAGVPPASLEKARFATFDTDDINALPPLESEVVDAALEGRPEILQAMLNYDQAETDLRIAVAAQYPEVRLGPGYTWERGLTKLPFGLSLTFPDRDFSRAAIAAAEARRAEAGRGLEAAVSNVLNGIASADADYRAAAAMLQLVRSETLPTARSLAAQAEREINAGSIDRAEWAAAQAGELSARLDEIVAVRGVLEAEAGLEDALRRPLRGPDMVVGRILTSVEGTGVQ